MRIKPWITGIILLNSQLGLSDGIRVLHDPEGPIYLTAPNCQMLEKEVNAIKRWALSRGEFPESLEVDCSKNPSPTRVDITPIIPKAIQSYYGQVSGCNGPNCYNAALLDQGLLKVPRHTIPDEWGYYLSNFCVERKLNEEPEPGDIVAIKKKLSANSFEHVHGFVYIGETSCSKNGLNRDKPCLIQPFEKVLQIYDVDSDPSCRKAKGIPPHCNIYVNYYRCSQIEHRLNEKVLEVEALYSRCALRPLESMIPLDLKKLSTALIALEYSVPELGENPLERSLTLASLKEQLVYLQHGLLDRAVENKEDETISQILANWSELKSDNFPLRKAIEYGSTETVRKALRAGASINGWPALALAADYGNLEIVQLLVENGAAINSLNKDGLTPLTQAVIRGHLDVVQYLLEKGANPFVRAPSGADLLELSIFSMKPTIPLIQKIIKKARDQRWSNKFKFK